MRSRYCRSRRTCRRTSRHFHLIQRGAAWPIRTRTVSSCRRVIKCSSSSTCRMTATGKPSEAAIFASPWPLSNRHLRIRSRVEGNRVSDVIRFLSTTSDDTGLRGAGEALSYFTMAVSSSLKFECFRRYRFIKPSGLNSTTKPKRDRAWLDRRIQRARQFCRCTPIASEDLPNPPAAECDILAIYSKHLANALHIYTELSRCKCALSRKKYKRSSKIRHTTRKEHSVGWLREG